MLIITLLFPAVCLGLSTSPCPKYSCLTNSSSAIGDICIYNSSYSYTVTPCSNSSLYCDISGPNQFGYCQETATFQSTSYPGEKCNNNTDCYSNICTNNICVGLPGGSSCASDMDCTVGFSCRRGICSSLISIGNSGCSSDYDCANNAGCSYLNAEAQGICIEYYSLTPYTIVSVCYGNKNKLCNSGICGNYLGKDLCLPELENSLNSPYSCNTSDYCYSEPDAYTKIVINGKCLCALNGKAYCSLFPGDPETYDYRNFRNAWVNTKEIHKCHTLRRFNRACMDQQWSNIKYSYWYYEDYANLYQVLYNASNCVMQVYYPDFYTNLITFQQSAGYLIMVALGTLVL